jgi:hypothetical protein
MAVLVLAIGIAVNVSAFSLFDMGMGFAAASSRFFDGSFMAPAISIQLDIQEPSHCC